MHRAAFIFATFICPIHVLPFHIRIPAFRIEFMLPVSPRRPGLFPSRLSVFPSPLDSSRWIHESGTSPFVVAGTGPVDPSLPRRRENKRERGPARSIASSGSPMSLDTTSAAYRTTCPNSSPHPGLPPLGKGSNRQEESTRDEQSRIHVHDPERFPAAHRRLWGQIRSRAKMVCGRWLSRRWLRSRPPGTSSRWSGRFARLRPVGSSQQGIPDTDLGEPKREINVFPQEKTQNEFGFLQKHPQFETRHSTLPQYREL